MSRSQRDKGAVGEREFVHLLHQHGFPAGIGRVLGQARDGGGDVLAQPFLFEVKRRHALAVRQFLDQAEEACAKYEGTSIPLVAMREDGRTDWIVMGKASDLLPILQYHFMRS